MQTPYYNIIIFSLLRKDVFHLEVIYLLQHNHGSSE